MAHQINSESWKNRGCVADTFLELSWVPRKCPHTQFPGPFWEPFSIKDRKKASKKGMQKNMSKKYRKIIPKVIKNDTKMDTKIDNFSNFSEKGWNARNYLFYNRKRGSEHLKMHEKSIQNRCKIDARKSYAKSMEDCTKIEAKWRPRSLKNPKICEKRHVENRCWN